MFFHWWIPGIHHTVPNEQQVDFPSPLTHISLADALSPSHAFSTPEQQTTFRQLHMPIVLSVLTNSIRLICIRFTWTIVRCICTDCLRLSNGLCRAFPMWISRVHILPPFVYYLLGNISLGASILQKNGAPVGPIVNETTRNYRFFTICNRLESHFISMLTLSAQWQKCSISHTLRSFYP